MWDGGTWSLEGEKNHAGLAYIIIMAKWACTGDKTDFGF